MDGAVLTQRSEVRVPLGAVEQEEGVVRYYALFWRSPFAVAAGIMISTLLMLMGLSIILSQSPSVLSTVPFILIAAMMLSVGLMPSWNFIEITEKGIEQHAGLTRLERSWSQVQNVRTFPHWVELRYVDDAAPGKKKVRTVRILNRYDIPSEDFGELIEQEWRRARSISF